MTTLNIAVVTAGAARHSASALLAEKLQQSVKDALPAGTSIKYSTHHLGQYIHDIADYLEGEAPGTLVALFEQLRAADAIITVTPIFKASYSGLFKLFWDLVEPDDIRGKPLLMAATGGSHRHMLALDYALRPLFSYLGADTCATGVYTTPGTLDEARTLDRIRRAAGELAQKIS